MAQVLFMQGIHEYKNVSNIYTHSVLPPSSHKLCVYALMASPVQVIRVCINVSTPGS